MNEINEIERLTDELINVEQVAKDRYCKMQSEIDELRECEFDLLKRLDEAEDEIERLRGDLQVMRLQRDARRMSESVVDDAVKAEIERLNDEVRSAHFDGYMAGVGDSEDYDYDPIKMEVEAWKDRAADE